MDLVKYKCRILVTLKMRQLHITVKITLKRTAATNYTVMPQHDNINFLTRWIIKYIRVKLFIDAIILDALFEVTKLGFPNNRK